MLKYKRYNAIKLAEDNDLSYLFTDIFRQTTIAKLVEYNDDMKKQDFINNALKICKMLLERSIYEE